jgi:hypothetical protein
MGQSWACFFWDVCLVMRVDSLTERTEDAECFVSFASDLSDLARGVSPSKCDILDEKNLYGCESRIQQ